MTDKKEAESTRIAQNGVVRPKNGTKTGRVWEHCDTISQAAGEPAERGAVIKACTAEGINQATTATQYGRWCKFNGVTKRVAKKEEPVEETKEEADEEDFEYEED